MLSLGEPALRRTISMRVLVLIASLLATVTGPVRAEPFPSRQITIVVPFAAGGPSDAMARLVAQGIGEQVGTRVIVENMAGAGGTIGSARVSRAEPDGHTLVFGNIGTHAANVGLYKALPYNPETDFEPVALIASVPFVVAVKRASPADDFAGFRARARAQPGTLVYGSAGIGSASHLAGLLLDAALGAKAQHIPYRGVALAMNDLVAGQIDFMCDQTVTMIPQIKGATVKPLAVMSRTRIARLPELPTVIEGGLAGTEVEAWNALFAPKGTSPAVVDRLFAVVWAALASPAIGARFADLGAVVPAKDAAAPQALRDHVAAEVRKWAPIIRNGGISAE
jgi:tripartite-type tricarboxylate transporter receptor subunit TctC